MAKITIGMADCIDNETFEQYVESVGLSRFDENEDPKDVDTITFDATLVEGKAQGDLVIIRADMDESTFIEILEKLEAPRNSKEVVVRVTNVQLT